MARLKDTGQSVTDGRDASAQDITATIEFAVQAFDGHHLSDKDLDRLCDAIMSEHPVSSRMPVRQQRTR